MPENSSEEMEEEEQVQVQDRTREEMIISLFALEAIESRLGHDALDEHENPFELKSSTKRSCSTGRDVSFEMIQKWRECYWLIARGRNLASGFQVDDIYFFHPSMLEGWFQKIENKLSPDVRLREKVIEILKGKLSQDELERLHYLISRGLTLNNPHIGGPYIEKNGQKIDLNRPKEHLRELIEKYPLN